VRRDVGNVHRTVKFGTEVIVHIPWPVTFDAEVDHKHTWAWNLILMYNTNIPRPVKFVAKLDHKNTWACEIWCEGRMQTYFGL